MPDGIGRCLLFGATFLTKFPRFLKHIFIDVRLFEIFNAEIKWAGVSCN